jgi:hypothetical protein
MKNHLKTSQNVIIRDLINVKVEPYSLPLIAKGSSNLQPRGNDPNGMATASVKVASSAFLKGQKVHMEIDLYHPSKVRRNPGCFIQLIRKESYNAGEYVDRAFYDAVVSSQYGHCSTLTIQPLDPLCLVVALRMSTRIQLLVVQKP